MTRRLAILPAAGLLALLVAACGGSAATTTGAPPSSAASAPAAASGSPSAEASATETATASESAEATESLAGASGSPEASFALPSFDLHGAPDLEAAIPASVNGQTLTKASFSMAQLAALSGGSESASDQAFIAWLGALGKKPSDVNVAVGMAEGTPSFTIGAIRIAGADQNQLVSTFLATSQQQKMTVTQTNLGGKSVAKIVDSTDQGGSPSYVYAKGDILYYVQADDESTAGGALTALP